MLSDLIQEDRYTFLSGKQLSDSQLFILVLREYPWPSQPPEVESLVSHLKDSRVDHAFRVFKLKRAILLPNNDDRKPIAHKDNAVFLVQPDLSAIEELGLKRVL